MISKYEVKLYLESTMPRNLVKLLKTNIYHKQNPYLEYQDKYQCIFIHIPKTGGKSILKVLFGVDAGGHHPILDYEIFDNHRFNTYFKFAFVRNPWDRLLSSYTYLKELSQNPDRFLSAYIYLQKSGKEHYDKIWSDMYLADYKDFESFVSALRNRKIASQILQGLHFRPQYQFICDYRLNIKVDFVGKLENINDDFQYIADRLGINTKLTHLNKSGHQDYRQVYNETMKQIAYDLYKKDIKTFGYSF